MLPDYNGRTGEVTLDGRRFCNLTEFYRFWAWHGGCEMEMGLYNTGAEEMNRIREQNNRMREALQA